MNRWRSERCERTFAHVCETGGGRRSWLRGLNNVSKAHVLKCAAYNLGLLLRKVWGMSKPRNWEESAALLFWLLWSLILLGAVITAIATDRFEKPESYALLLLILAAEGYGMVKLHGICRKTWLF